MRIVSKGSAYATQLGLVFTFIVATHWVGWFHASGIVTALWLLLPYLWCAEDAPIALESHTLCQGCARMLDASDGPVDLGRSAALTRSDEAIHKGCATCECKCFRAQKYKCTACNDRGGYHQPMSDGKKLWISCMHCADPRPEGTSR